MSNMSILSDPCPLPTQKIKRNLHEAERHIYAPMAGVGGILYDKDAVYIDVDDNQKQKVSVSKT